MKSIVCIIFLILSLQVSATSIKYGDPNQLFHTSIRDLALYSKNIQAKQLAQKIIDMLHDKEIRVQLFGTNLSFLDEGPHRITLRARGKRYKVVKDYLDNTIYGVEITQINEGVYKDIVQLQLLAHNKREKHSYKVYFIELSYDSSNLDTLTLEVLKVIPLKQFVF